MKLNITQIAKMVIFLICFLGFSLTIICSKFIGAKDNFNEVENNMEIKISSKTKNVFELVKNIYTNEILDEISNLDYSLSVLNSKYPIECLRKEDNIYKAIYRSDDSFLIIYFNKDGTKKLERIFKQSITLEELNKINIGTNLETVMNTDINGDYINFYTGIDSSKVSEHYTSDGYYVIFTYDDNYNLVSTFTKYI